MSTSPGRIAPKRRPGRRLAAAPTGSVGAPTGIDAPSDTIRIRTRGLTKRYDDLVAVDHLDLDIHAGEIFGLLGQNGAGKTTTILMLLGLTEPSGGSARVVGLDPARGPLEVKRRVGYMPDQVGFYGDLTGRENLRYTARLNRVARDLAETTINEVLDQVGLSDRADDKTETYSRGMLQRLGIADALVKDPDVLILDEPTTAIDPLGVGEVLDLLRRLVRERGMAILLSSHLLNQVQSVCDRIGIFASGRLIGQGTMEELANRFGDGRREIEVGLDLPEGADDSDARAALRAVPGVAAVDDGSRPGEPWVLTVAPGHDPSEVRSRVLAVVAAEALPLASIRAVLPSLEDIYRRAVAQPAKPVARGDAARTGRTKTVGAAAAATPVDQAHPVERPDAEAAREPDRAVWLEPVEPVVLPSDTPTEEDPR
ncbi:MAG: type transport system ATP-binding protein [Chloroflexota bacterium]|nr:type transport system ATP-binding protein [Chloroflexota bacterium]